MPGTHLKRHFRGDEAGEYSQKEMRRLRRSVLSKLRPEFISDYPDAARWNFELTSAEVRYIAKILQKEEAREHLRAHH